jgi:hypothetical protein
LRAWSAGTLAKLRQVALDLTALSATIEALGVRYPGDDGVERAALVVESLVRHIDAVVEQLRER